MKKRGKKKNSTKIILIVVAAAILLFFLIIPAALTLVLTAPELGNVARIPIEGPITGNGASYLGAQTVSSQQIIHFIEQANENPQVRVILIEINSPGGSAVASDEIATAIKMSQKPVVSLIREAGASGGYWIASATDHIVANRMSITGSIGVISSYLEFSGLMNEHGIGYEQLTSGEYKDLGTPFRKLSTTEKAILQKKIDTIHGFFVQEVANNRDMPISKVKKLATGEFYLGTEAKELGLIDELGDIYTLEEYIKFTYDIDAVSYVNYQRQAGFFDVLAGAFSDFSFNMGQGIGSIFLKHKVPFTT